MIQCNFCKNYFLVRYKKKLNWTCLRIYNSDKKLHVGLKQHEVIMYEAFICANNIVFRVGWFFCYWILNRSVTLLSTHRHRVTRQSSETRSSRSRRSIWFVKRVQMFGRSLKNDNKKYLTKIRGWQSYELGLVVWHTHVSCYLIHV